MTSTPVTEIRDRQGRRLQVKRLSALDTLRLLKAAGPALAQNQPWLSMAMIAASVTAIDDVPIPPPQSEAQVEGIVERLGADGMEAVAEVSGASSHDLDERQLVNAGNSPGTPSC